MNIDTHWHVIVPTMTRELSGGSEPWRPSVRWQNGEQIVEIGGRVVRSAIKEFVRVERMLEEAEALGVDHALLCPWVNLIPTSLDAGAALEICTLQNESLSAMTSTAPERLSALGVLPLGSPETAARELSALMKLPGIRGVEVTASVGGVSLGDDRFLPFWEAAEAEDAFIFIHPTTKGFDLPALSEYYLWNTVGNPLETTITAAHMIMAGVLERFPRLKLLLAHGGGAILALRGRLRHSAGFQPLARKRLEGSVDESMQRFYFDTVTHDPELLRELIAYVGAGHVLLGSDYPFDMGTYRAVEEVRELRLSPLDEKAILGATAARLLGLAEEVVG